MDQSKRNEVYFCDYTKYALESMKQYGITNADVQEIFNHGFSGSHTHKFIDKNGFRTGISYDYDPYTLRYVIITVYRRSLSPLGRRRK